MQLHLTAVFQHFHSLHIYLLWGGVLTRKSPWEYIQRSHCTKRASITLSCFCFVLLTHRAKAVSSRLMWMQTADLTGPRLSFLHIPKQKELRACGCLCCSELTLFVEDFQSRLTLDTPIKITCPEAMVKVSWVVYLLIIIYWFEYNWLSINFCPVIAKVYIE